MFSCHDSPVAAQAQAVHVLVRMLVQAQFVLVWTLRWALGKRFVSQLPSRFGQFRVRSRDEYYQVHVGLVECEFL